MVAGAAGAAGASCFFGVAGVLGVSGLAAGRLSRRLAGVDARLGSRTGAPTRISLGTQPTRRPSSMSMRVKPREYSEATTRVFGPMEANTRASGFGASRTRV